MAGWMSGRSPASECGAGEDGWTAHLPPSGAAAALRAPWSRLRRMTEHHQVEGIPRALSSGEMAILFTIRPVPRYPMETEVRSVLMPDKAINLQWSPGVLAQLWEAPPEMAGKTRFAQMMAVSGGAEWAEGVLDESFRVRREEELWGEDWS